MYRRSYPLVSDITFIKGARVCVCVRACLPACVLTEAIPGKHLAKGPEASCPTQ